VANGSDPSSTNGYARTARLLERPGCAPLASRFILLPSSEARQSETSEQSLIIFSCLGLGHSLTRSALYCDPPGVPRSPVTTWKCRLAMADEVRQWREATVFGHQSVSS